VKLRVVEGCDECGFAYEDHLPPLVVDEMASLGSRYRQRLHVDPGDEERVALLRRRPNPEVWSALEYACHVRDVLLAQRERLFLALVEDCPSFAPIYREQRVVLAGYAREDPGAVAEHLEVAAALVAAAFRGVDEEGWRRECVYNFPAPAKRSIVWLAAHTLHEGEHHLRDCDRVMNSVGVDG
jgi:hypothetical protein